MIGYLEGTVIFTGGNWVILKAGPIGYKVYSVGFYANSNEELALFIHDHIREDRHELYGFKEQQVLELFEQLIEISGVGTKLAQKILTIGSSEEISSHILKGDLAFLTSIPGVGKKTAQKIILELKGILVQEEDHVIDADTIEALMSLGYPRQDCIDVLREVSAEGVDERIKAALQLLGSK